MPKKAQTPVTDERYTVGSWNGMPNYHCRSCAFSTVDQRIIERHYAEAHTLPTARQTVTVPIYDRFGNLIEQREV